MASEEQQYYDALWKKADTNSDGQLNGSEAVQFLRHSGLSVDQLEEIWNVIDVLQKGYWTKTEFYYGLRLIGLVQHGVPPSAAALKATTAFPIPRFDSVAVAAPVGIRGGAQPVLAAPSSPSPSPEPPPPQPLNRDMRFASAPKAAAPATASAAPASSSISPSMAPRRTVTAPPSSKPAAAAAAAAPPAFPAHVSRQQLQTYQQHFASLDAHRSGFLTGQQARDFFLKSNLSNAVLGRVWEMADVDRDNKLTFGEFVLAMHLITAILAGCTVPTPLPLSLHPSAITTTTPPH